jgi:molybdate transport system substrate-binding protein
MAAAVRTGDPVPDLSTVESFKQALLNAPRVAYSASASGTYLSEEVFPKILVSLISYMNFKAAFNPL